MEVITKKQFHNSIRYVDEIINNLSDRALLELLGGYSGDITNLFNELLIQTDNVINFNQTLDSEKFSYLTNFEKSVDEQLRILSYNYFKTTCLPNFHQGWRNLEWGNMIQLYPYLAILASRSHGKCFARGTEVLMFDGSLKNIEDIVIGDELMGVDGTIRKVLSLHSGVDDMYEVEQKQSLNYTVNSSHDLYFDKHYNKKFLDENREVISGTYWRTDSVETLKMSAVEFFNKSKSFKGESFGKKVKGWELPEKDLLIDPYWLGLWLGDGNKDSTGISSTDLEVVEYIKNYALRLGLRYSCHGKLDECKLHNIVTNNGGAIMKNILLDYLREYNLLGNKHIPNIYLRGSRRQRLELLAGLLDSDGSYYPENNNYNFSQKDLYLTKQVQLLCWSLGFRCNFSRYKNYLKSRGEDSYSYSSNIFGEIWTIPCKIERKKPRFYKIKKSPQRCGLDIKYIGRGEFFGFTCDKDHLFLLKDGTIVSNSYETCYAFPLWRLYSYNKPSFYSKDTIDNKNRKETLIITNTQTLGSEHMDKIVEEIKFNDILREKLNPYNKAQLGSTGITTETGSKIHLRGIGGFFRGLHTGSVVADDVPDESSIYSQEQRDKLRDKFFGGISPIVEPYGHFLVSGTPYSEKDIYWNIKQDPRFLILEYPAIFPDGRLLSPDRFTWEKLMEEKESLGSLVFSREYLVVPISDDATIFPYDILMRSTIGMENIDLVDNISSFPFKLNRVVIGCDFAKSANVGADYTVYTVWGSDSMNNYYLLHLFRRQGLSHNEQISQLVSLDQRFKPNKIRVETNGFQQILADLAKQRGLRNIEEHVTTGSNKKNWYDGLPGHAALFERGQIKIPWREGDTRTKVETLFQEYNSVTFRPDKGTLESISGHDDIPMSCHFAISDLRDNTNRFKVYSV